jgi:D-alanyl-lipoteichoic acid acyltransferase DltB (MBOAT superfamily)
MPELTARNFRRPTSENFYQGISLFILGLGKKVLLADVLAIIVNAEFNNIDYLDAPSAWITIICYMLELYFDFSGYCDMARGIGKMFGFHLPENFDAPLMAVSVKDFWRRWHKTLSRFLSTYIYIPLGGNRRGLAIQCRNLFIVFLVSGFWHGANWTFVVWGLLHGAAMIWETVFPKLRFHNDNLNRLITGIYVTLTFAVFRSNSLSDAALLFKKLFAGGYTGFVTAMSNVLQIPETYVIRKFLELKFPQLLNPFYITCLCILLAVSILFITGKKAEVWIDTKGRSIFGTFLLATVFTWSFISLSQVSTFLYFNF